MPPAAFNRGVALAGDRVFMVTDNAHIIGLNRFTGDLLWETEMADWRLNYNATSAPLIVGDLVVSGTSGGDEGVRGFLAGVRSSHREGVWRFWTVPKAGEPGAETWRGSDIEHPGSVTWFTGSYESRAQHNLLADGQSGQRSQWRSAPAETIFTRARGRAGRQDREAQVVLPVHPATTCGIWGRD